MGDGLLQVSLVHGDDAQVGQRGGLRDPVTALAGGFQQLLGHRDRAAQLVGAHDPEGVAPAAVAFAAPPPARDQEELRRRSAGTASSRASGRGPCSSSSERRLVLGPCQDEVGLPFAASLRGLPVGEHPRLLPPAPVSFLRSLPRKPMRDPLPGPRRGRGGRADPALDLDLPRGASPDALPVLELAVAIGRQPEHDPVILAGRLGKDALVKDHLLPVRYPGPTCPEC